MSEPQVIATVSARHYEVPVTVPYVDSTFQLPLILVRLETEHGLTGHGIATGPGTAEAMTRFVVGRLESDLVGRDAWASERIWQDLHVKYNNWAGSGFWSSVQSAIDVAIWDIKGKALGLPIATLLGGYRSEVPVYVTFGTSEHTTDGLVAFAKELVAQGHRGLKMVVGGLRHPKPGSEGMRFDETSGFPALERDAQRVLAVREAIGPDVDLMIDGNCRFSFVDAAHLCRLVEEAGLAWFEEPIVGNDPRLLARLRTVTSIPIAAGQRFGHLWAHRQLIETGAVDVPQPNVVHGGGFTEGLRVAAVARAHNLPIATGGAWPHHNLHLQAAVANGTYVEFHWLAWMTGDALFDQLPRPSRAMVPVPQRPGLGFEPKADEELARYLVDHG